MEINNTVDIQDPGSVSKVGYKETKIGFIPEDWDFDLLEKYASRGSGHTPNKKKPEYYNGGIKWVSLADSANLDNGLISETKIEISKLGIENSSATLLKRGTVILSRDAGVGKSAVMEEDMAVSQHFITWTTDENKYHNWFLYYWLQQRKREFERIAIGSTIKTIGLPYFKKYNVPIPPILEQKKIAEILFTWDAAIEQTITLLDQLSLRKKGLMQQLLTGTKRLRGYNSVWKEYSYGSILKEINRPVKWDDDELYELISVKRRSGGLFHRESLYGKQILTKGLKTTKTGDFLISKMQIVHGASGLTTEEFDGMKISGSYISFIAKEERILDIEFFSWLSKMPYFYYQTFIASYGVHIEKMTFNFKSFLKLRTLIPPIEEQKAIVEILSTAEVEIQVQEKYLAQLQTQKKGLMQKLLTGEIRVEV